MSESKVPPRVPDDRVRDGGAGAASLAENSFCVFCCLFDEESFVRVIVFNAGVESTLNECGVPMPLKMLTGLGMSIGSTRRTMSKNHNA